MRPISSLVRAAVIQMVFTTAYCISTSRLPASSGPNHCEAINFTMSLYLDGCKRKFIENRYCYGQCSSIFHSSYVHEKETAPFSCSTCVPSIVKTKKIFFDCPDNPEKMRKHRRVTVIEKCSCRNVKCFRVE